MGSTSLAGEVRYQRAFLSDGELVARGLAYNDKIGLPLKLVGLLRAIAAAFLAHHKEKTEVINRLAAKAISRFEHCRNDSFGVARPAAIKKIFVFANGQNGRNRIQVRAENHAGITGECENVEAIRYQELLLDTVPAIMKKFGQKQPDFFFTACD